MTAHKSGDSLHLGFLRVLEIEVGAHVGGILVTNQLGRPLEFQCTTAVRPNRTQAILYGPTLTPFLYSDLIGKTLFARLDVKPQLIVADQPALLPLRDHVSIPVACVVDPSEDRDLADVTRWEHGRFVLQFHADHVDDRDIVGGQLAKLPADADLREPLERVSEALRESLRVGAVA
jgi:hypothetical protein